jgi:CoA-transferase family III
MGALGGMRILECGELVAAPYSAKLLGHLGADVVKIEPPEGDPARRRGPFPGSEAHAEQSGLHLYLNQGKRSMVVDWPRSGDVELPSAQQPGSGGGPAAERVGCFRRVAASGGRRARHVGAVAVFAKQGRRRASGSSALRRHRSGAFGDPRDMESAKSGACARPARSLERRSRQAGADQSSMGRG